MTSKLLSLQRPDGLWTVSLLDPEELNMGESSGTAFFTFAMVWGINNGLIDMKYKPNVIKAWTALTHNNNDMGRLGYVQQVGGNPFPFQADQWHVYATGTYFMAGK
jgi:rhamnogalacturonyl hydrolase YesR